MSHGKDGTRYSRDELNIFLNRVALVIEDFFIFQIYEHAEPPRG